MYHTTALWAIIQGEKSIPDSFTLHLSSLLETGNTCRIVGRLLLWAFVLTAFGSAAFEVPVVFGLVIRFGAQDPFLATIPELWSKSRRYGGNRYR